MAFTTSFLSGLTLTSFVLYYSLQHHQRSRAHQASLLHASALQLNTLVDPQLAAEIATLEDQNFSGGVREYRMVKYSALERVKDGWNRELEKGVRWAHQLDMGKVRDGIEEKLREWEGDQRRV